jgi:ArsR family transcriptional regulator, virulence genes transcriptional regulator
MYEREMQTAPAMADLEAHASEAADYLKLLANPHRLQILCHLADVKEASVTTLTQAVGLSQSALSQHLAKLRDDDLVTYRRESQTLFYRVSDTRALRLLQLLKDLFCPPPSPAGHAPLPSTRP